MTQGGQHTSLDSSAAVVPRALIVGEALIDVIGSGESDEPTRAIPGGSPANVAVGLARLGVPTELVTHLGTDPYGDLLATHLRYNGVHLAAESVEAGVRTSTATATLDPAGIASYEFDIDWDPPAPTLSPECRIVHTGSIAALLEPGAKTIREFVRGLAARPVTVTLDPNARPKITPDPQVAWAAVRDLAAASDLIKLSDEDCAFLLPGASPEQVAAELLTAVRTKCVVITRGSKGAVGHTRTLHVEVDAPSVEVADTVGAGVIRRQPAGLTARAALLTGVPRGAGGARSHCKPLLGSADTGVRTSGRCIRCRRRPVRRGPHHHRIRSPHGLSGADDRDGLPGRALG